MTSDDGRSAMTQEHKTHTTGSLHTWGVGVGDVVLSVLQVELTGVQRLHDAGHVVGHQLQRAGGRLGLAQHG